MNIREHIFRYLTTKHSDITIAFIMFAVRSLEIKDIAKIQLELRKRWRK